MPEEIHHVERSSSTVIDGMPVMAKVAAVIGVPSTIALYLVWVMSSGVASASQLELHNQNTHQAQEQIIDLLQAQVRLQRVICINSAKTDAARVECSR